MWSRPPGQRYLRTLPKESTHKYLLQFEPARDHNGSAQRNEYAPSESLIGTPVEQIESAYHAFASSVQGELLERILQQSPEFFEHLILDLVRAMGYGGSSPESSHHLGKANDEGIDGVIDEDKLGLDKIFLQAKRYKPGNSIGRPALQMFVGSMTGRAATKGVFVTTSNFTEGARKYAESVT